MVRKLIRIVDPEKSLTWLEDFIDVVFTEKANGTINITNGLIVLNSTELIPADYPVWKLQDYRILCSAAPMEEKLLDLCVGDGKLEYRRPGISSILKHIDV